MTDKPIIFSAPMVRALLDGRKSQTRRVLRPQLGSNISQAFEAIPGKWRFLDHDGVRAHQIMRLPFAPGDRLYVREAWCTSPAYDDIKPSEMGGDESIRYAADGTWESWGWGNLGCVEGRSRPSIHMPRWASRLTLLVTDVRVQRLQEISEDDAVAEGLRIAPGGWWSGAEGQAGPDPISAFVLLWNSIHGPEAWGANPWVAAISFTVHRGNIDQMTPTPQDRPVNSGDL